MNTLRTSNEAREPIVFTPPRHFDVGTAAWTVASSFFYGAATLCTLYWVLYLLLFGFTVDLTFPILFWNIVSWLIAAYARKRVRETRQRAAIVRERREALANAVTEAAQDALTRKATLAAGSLPTRRAHWWTDTPLREENQQRLGR